MNAENKRLCDELGRCLARRGLTFAVHSSEFMGRIFAGIAFPDGRHYMFESDQLSNLAPLVEWCAEIAPKLPTP